MNELQHLDPTGRFTGRAQLYAECRPDYPAAALDHIGARCRLQPGSVLADIGAGTGISSRLFAARGLRVVGIEPNDDMRRQAELAASSAAALNPAYQAGKGEATGLPSGSVDVVVCCQAFHWLDPALALPEFHRILKPGGWAALMWNERDESDPFAHAFGDVMRTFPNARSLEGARQQAGQAFMRHPLFEETAVHAFPHGQPLTEDQLVGRALSVSYAPVLETERTQAETAIRRVFRRFAATDSMVLAYRTSVFTGRRREATIG